MNQEIELFIERAELLRQCSFFNPKHKIKSNMSYKRGQDVKITSSTPPRESIESLGMRIRIFIAQKEPIRFDKFVRKLIKLNPENKEKYDEYLRVYKGIIDSSPMVIREEKGGKVSEYTGYYFMWDQLYGEYFHLDKKRRARINHFQSLLGGIPESMALSKLHQLAQLIVHLSIFLQKSNIAKQIKPK